MEAFAILPSSSAPTPGSQLTLLIRSAEPLDTPPRVTITQPGTTARTVTARRLADGRYRAVLALAASVTGTATLVVTGADVHGKVDTTLLKLAVR